MTRLLRFIALAIAIAGLVDPAISLSGASRARIAVVAQKPSSSASDNVRARLIRELSPSYEIVPDVTSDASAAVVIGDRYPEAAGADTRVRPLDSMVVSTVTTPVAAASGARLVRVDAPADVPTATLVHLDVELEGAGVEGQTTEVTAVMAGVEVGRASHRWVAGETRWGGGIDAVPVGDPPYVLRIGAGRSVADVVVDLRREPIRVEFFDPRPSWATTFVRRALEADARFQVAALSFTSRGVSAQTGGAVPLADRRLDAFAVVIAGGLERLSGGDAGALERFMRERGGAVVLLPDQRIDAGPARDLIPGPDLEERLLERPAKLAVTPPAASLQASELLLLRAPTPGADVLARVPGTEPSAVIASAPRGDGRLLFSGAMDAWRFRAADSGAFDRFWQSAIAGLALAVPPPIAIAVEPPLLRPGEQGEVVVRVRARDVTAVSAVLDGDQPIRLRPDPEAGVYRGRFTAKASAGRSTLEVRAAGPQSQSASRAILVRPEVERRSIAAPALSMLASSHRGIDVPPDRLAELEQFLRNTIASPRATSVRHPMRSTWWILPFAACLSAEWWIRRRRGLR
jgi:hypothetical protein